MFKKQKKSAIYLLASLSIAYCYSDILAPVQTDCAAVTCLIGNSCVNGVCIPNQDEQKEKIPETGNLNKHDACYPEVTSPAGCIKSCKTPEFANCKDMIFPLLFDPKFCGYNQKQNRWIDYTFNCQACADDDVIGFIDSKCNCTLTGCAENQTCDQKSGICETIQKPTPKCSNQVPAKIQCANRPTKEECPDIFYIRAPDLNKCGIDSEGNRVGFARDCEVCIDPKFNFYYDDFCEKVPQLICEDYEFCTIQGNCIDRCAAIRCASGFECSKGACRPLQKGKCHGDENCESYQFCNEGQCFDKCAMIKCANATCVKGQCIPNEPVDECKGQCKDYQRCFEGKCRDQCEFLRCAGCYKGKCGVFNPDPQPIIPVDECNGQCKEYERCFKGQCRDQCEFLKCANCYKGQCGVILEPQCKKDYECGFANKCNEGKCVDKCLNVHCEKGYQCQFGSCFRSFNYGKRFGYASPITQNAKIYKGKRGL